MSAHSVRLGAVAAGLLAGFYAVVVGGASGLDHLAGQARANWYLLAPILGGFGCRRPSWRSCASGAGQPISPRRQPAAVPVPQRWACWPAAPTISPTWRRWPA